MDRFCRGCLVKYEEPTELLQYTEKNRRLFVYCTGLQVKRTDSFTFQLCRGCYMNMKVACNFKKQCRNSDKLFKSYHGLRENEENLDLSTFLKTNDDSWTFRFPGNSTPAYQRAIRDDDNESTTTSIRNFMNDIMPDEFPDTEARIIKEVIDEEADILDDSLDSHWMHDDASIDSDFKIDISFSPFSTPRPVNNDRYMPKKEPEIKTENNTGEPKEINAKKILASLHLPKLLAPLESPKDFDIIDMPQIHEGSNHAEMPSIPIKEERNFDETMDSLDESPKDFDITDMPQIHEGSNHAEMPSIPIKEERHFDETDSLDESPKDFDILDMPQIHEGSNYAEMRSIPMKEERHFDETMDSLDVVNDFLKRESENTDLIEAETASQCTIDRNLEEALKNSENKEFALDELLVSPNEMPYIKSPATPFINNILFGDKLDLNETSNSPKYISSQCIETFENVTGNVEITDYTSNIDIKMEEIDIDALKSEIIEEIDKHALLEERHENQEKENQFNITNFYCNMCQKKFKSLMGLQRHSKLQHQHKIRPRRVWICDYCGLHLTDRTNFVRHIGRKHMRPPVPKLICEFCKMEFQTQNTLKQHRRTHTGQEKILKNSRKRFICTECGATTDKASNHAVHMKRHTKSYSYTCPECQKGFYRKAELTIHMRYHTGEKPFACPHCDMRFARRDCLTKHVTKHLDMKPFKCVYCKSRFINSTNLRKHLKTSKNCLKDRETISRNQLKLDENSSEKSVVTEQKLVKVIIGL